MQCPVPVPASNSVPALELVLHCLQFLHCNQLKHHSSGAQEPPPGAPGMWAALPSATVLASTETGALVWGG